VLTVDTARHVALICRELEGLPLAIELAAARARVLSPAQIAAGLTDRMRLLGGGAATGSERLRSMRGSLDWSYALLDERERALLRNLAISSEWTLDAIEAVCTVGAEESTASLDTLTALADRGLLSVIDDGGSELRYRLLETVRSYALEHLQSTGEELEVRRRHMHHFRGLAALADELLETPSGRRRLERDAPALLAALEFALSDDPPSGLEMAADLGHWWLIHESYEQARGACARVLAATTDGDARARAQVLWAAALLAVLDEDYQQARSYAEEAFPLAQASGDQRTIGRWMIMAGNAQRSIDANAAARIGAQAVAILHAEGDTHGLAFALANLALSEGMRDHRFDAVRERCEEFAALPGEKPSWLLPWVENALAWADISQGQPRSALEHCERALALEAARVTLPYYIATAHRLQALALAGRAHQARAQGLAELDRSQRAGLAIASAAIERSVTIAELALGDLDSAEARAERGLSGPHRYVTAEWRETLMRIALARDDAQTAREHAQELRAFAESTGSARKLAQANWGQGVAGLLSDELDRTHEALHAALRTQAEQGLAPEAIDTLEALGELALACEHATRASRLIGAARSARQALGVVPIPGRADGSPALSRRDHQELLDSERCVAALADGEAMTLTRAIEFARRGRGRRERPTRGWASLSPVESEVATLAAEGLTNPQIARHMYISRGTVKNHLSHIYKKLDVSNRVALTAATATRTPDQPSA
jgi:predicted ATPase/DNA-binding CsgD family transcriptional regulator